MQLIHMHRMIQVKSTKKEDQVNLRMPVQHPRMTKQFVHTRNKNKYMLSIGFLIYLQLLENSFHLFLALGRNCEYNF